MSLPHIAEQLAKKGRHGDTMLVHMSKDEVRGLAQIAKANGENITINPETGLPEAFSLGKVFQAALPVAAGFALGPAGAGVFSSALGAGLAVGGAYGLTTGSLQKGLMAGLGAYGGAGLSGAGTGWDAFAGSAPAATTVATPTAASLTGGLGSTAGMTGASNALASGSSLVPTGASSSFGLGATGAANTGFGLSAGAAPGTIAGTAAAPSTIGTTAMNFIRNNPGTAAATLGLPILSAFTPEQPKIPEQDKGMIRPYTYTRTQRPEAYESWKTNPTDTSERAYFDSGYTALEPYKAADGGQVPRYEQMAPGGLSNIQGIRDGYGAPQTVDGNIPQFADGGYTYDPATQRFSEVKPEPAKAEASPRGLGFSIAKLLSQQQPQSQQSQDPFSLLGIRGFSRRQEMPENNVGAYFDKEENRYLPKYSYDPVTQSFRDITPGLAQGGHLGDYSDGGRLLKGPGDGVSDSIPATINQKQPARLADGEFVVPARIVSELGNGSTDAGARKLYNMMDRVQKRRSKTIGKDKIAVNSKADKELPA